MKNNTKRLISLAMLIALQIILSRFLSFSAWNVKMGFGFVPIAAAGILFGPVPAAIVGGLSDFLGAALFPIGPYFPGFTLTAALTGLAYGLLLQKRQGFWQIAGAVAFNQFFLGLCVNTLWISLLYGSPFWGLLPSRAFQCAVLAPAETLVLCALTKPIQFVRRRALT